MDTAMRAGLSLSVGDVFAALWYPIVITAMACIIGSLLLANRPSLSLATDHLSQASAPIRAAAHSQSSIEVS